jgi:hypothetical protein
MRFAHDGAASRALPAPFQKSYVALQQKGGRDALLEVNGLPASDGDEAPMSMERPYPGQLWNYGGIRIVIVAVSPTTVTFEDLSGGRGVTRENLADFLALFKPLRR